MKTPNVLITKSFISPTSTEVLLEGHLSIANAAGIKNELQNILENTHDLHVILKTVVKIDLSVLQLLLALRKTAANVNKAVSLQFETTDYIKSVLRNSGLEINLINQIKN